MKLSTILTVTAITITISGCSQEAMDTAQTSQHKLPPVTHDTAARPHEATSARKTDAEGRPMPVHKKAAPTEAATPGGEARLAIIIDDMGADSSVARKLAAIGTPLTFSILPGLGQSHEAAAIAAERGLGIMLHIPMQPRGWPATRLEKNGLLASMDDKEIADRVKAMLLAIPEVRGANNHMGSAFTEQYGKMRVVTDTLAQFGQFFIDSRTTGKSAAEKAARDSGLPAAGRDTFLDNSLNEDAITAQVNSAASIARRRGHAIAIGHPHKETVAVLERMLPELEAQGIKLVTAAELAR